MSTLKVRPETEFVDNASRTSPLSDLGPVPRPFLSGWQAFTLLLAILSLCYISALVTSFANYDECVQLWARITGVNWTTQTEIAYGRPIRGVLNQILLSPMSRIGDLRYLRFLSVVTIAALAWAIYRTLLRVRWNWCDAFFFSLILGALPPFQVSLWAPTGYFPLAALSSVEAFSLAERALTESRAKYKWSFSLASVLLELLAATIFQPGAMFFWIPAAIVMFRPEVKLSWLFRQLIWYAGIFAAGMILAFGVYHAGLAKYGFMVPAERTHLTRHIWDKVVWFVQRPAVDALNLISLHSNATVACGVAVVGSCGLITYFRGSIGERFSKFGIALCLIPVSYMPNLMTAENWSAYRSQVTLTSLILVYLAFACIGYLRLVRVRKGAGRVLTGALGVTALAAVLLAASNVQTCFVLPLSMELRLMRSQLTAGDLNQAHSVYVIGSTWQDSLAPEERYDEFGYPFSAAPWGPGPAAHLLLRELGYAAMPVNVAPVEGPVKPPDGALVVDMRRLAYFR